MDELYTSRLKKFRKMRTERSTQLDFSEDIGVTPEYYSNIENGYKSPSVGLHISICKALGVPSDCFCNRSHEDPVLSAKQREHLQSLSTSQLKMLLELIRTIDESNNLDDSSPL